MTVCLSVSAVLLVLVVVTGSPWAAVGLCGLFLAGAAR